MRRNATACPRPARLLFLLACAWAFSGCRGCDSQAAAIAPQIYLDACADPQREVQGKLIGGYRECAHDFGDVDISVKVKHDIVVTNPSIVELTFDTIAIIEGDPAFKVELAPERIGPGLSGVITVSVRPKVEAPIAAVLSILSDANNTDQTAESLSLVEVQLTANGVDNGVPDIKVTPLECDFGRVAQGGVQVCPVSVTNEGNRGLVLDSVTFIPPTDAADATLFDTPPDSVRNGGTDGVCDPSLGEEECAFAFTGRPPGPEEEIAPNSTAVLTARFTPDVLGNFSGKFRVLSNDPDEEQIDVTLGGISVTPPTCAIRIKSVNGVDVPPGGAPEIEPLDNVIVTLEDSTPSTLEGAIAAYEWNIPANGRPAGSTVQLTTPTAETTGFTFDDDLGIDLAGTYTVRAVVYDDLGTGSVNECQLSFDAVPKDHFLVQLSWDTPTNDIDLHVTKQASNGDYCIDATSGDTVVDGLLSEDCDNGLDCNYAGCKAGTTYGTPPEWDGAAGRTAGDPALDIDDLSGFGPENINVDNMSEGAYLVGVDSFSMSQSSGVTVRIFIFGRLAAEFFTDLANTEWFEAAVVHWPADALTEDPCIEDLTDGDATDECG
ncbi:MAG: choice-of-anchor D domain-containing protein [Deltaproteobacteria bacterium]|nr:choice-of-anchor D domain-containing protein [Deltaproteobacteria bacterium]